MNTTQCPAISNQAHKPLGQSALCYLSYQVTYLQWLYLFQDYIIHRLQMEDELIANVSKHKSLGYISVFVKILSHRTPRNNGALEMIEHIKMAVAKQMGHNVDNLKGRQKIAAI